MLSRYVVALIDGGQMIRMSIHIYLTHKFETGSELERQKKKVSSLKWTVFLLFLTRELNSEWSRDEPAPRQAD